MEKKKSKFKSYGVFDKKTNERVMVIKATKIQNDYKERVCTFYFAHIEIGKVDTKNYFVYELL